ncbi:MULTISPECIES: tellurite resistance TerB family protein [Hyphobacterium]|uniref:TerB family tellurite resistance protein n=1 Tax=Hyphobacterium vulgare TaxID=1736751 RepID=A0ABV6ZY66_9PROT
MLDALKRLFAADRPKAHPELDPQVAATALLVEAALADGVYAKIEAAQIRSILMAAFDLPEETARQMLEEAEDLAEAAVDHYQFTKVVKACLPKAQRVSLIEHLWSVALSDGEKSPFEESFIRTVAPLLAVDDRERVFARSRAEAAARKR